MSIIDEKRQGTDRRVKPGDPPPGTRERRKSTRRQTTIEEIPFSEWATHFVRFNRKLSAKTALRQDKEAATPAIESAK